MAKNTSEKCQKYDSDVIIVQKKRRNLKGMGCIGEMSGDCDNLKLKRGRIEEISCSNAGMVSILGLSFREGFGEVEELDLILRIGGLCRPAADNILEAPLSQLSS